MKITAMLGIIMASGLLLATTPAMAKQEGKSLPPGLQKKVAEGRSLPPGWQKKLAVGHHLDRDIYSHGHIIEPIDNYGYVTVEIEDRRLRLLAATLEIIEILH
ncbi:hypothetical protein [Zhongshania sp.]|jgi:hypothetical protein|uniref:hypothetical protein n=1 Tax=Zhongshania sp. TaxID=1971902 RepID=UPI002A823335|nr:hypothetical protein [Zhongshania sp.]